MKRHIAFLAVASLCLAAAPAGATIHPGKDDSHGNSIVLQKSGGPGKSHLGKPLPIVRFDLSDLGRHDNGKHLGLLKKLRDLKHHKNKPSPNGEGGGVIVPPTHGGDVPVPEPSAALLFGVGTGIVALRLRRLS